MRVTGPVVVTFGLAACGGGGGASNAPLAVSVEATRPAAPLVSGEAGPIEPAPPSVEIGLGIGRICAAADGHVYCTRTLDPDEPVVAETNAIAGIDDATGLAVGQGFVCAGTRRGKVRCAGDNTFGQLGAKLAVERSEASVEVVGLDRVKRVFAGPWHACASLEDMTLRCWGRNENGQTGSDTVYRPEARELAGASVVSGVKSEELALAFSATCARSGADITCWGLARDDGSAARANERPHTVAALAGMERMGAGESAFCGISGGKVMCWGEGRRLVTGGRSGSAAGAGSGAGAGPMQVGTIATAKQIAVADDHVCVLLADGRVSCFGYPYSQALGRATDENAYEAVPPTLVEDLPRVVAISVASGLSCAITRDTELFCWGRWYNASGSRSEPKPTRFRLR